MISYLNGIIILKKDKFIILEVNNVGYKIFIPRQTLSNLPEIGQNINALTALSTSTSAPFSIKLFCFHNITETASDLYGFLTHEQLDFFEVLMDIRGVGPKAALEISSLGPLEKIKDKILAQDGKIFQQIPGIGSKKAMAIILELTGKIKLLNGTKNKKSEDPAEDALVQLGFKRTQAKEALSNVSAENVEDRIKQALKNLQKS